MTELDAVRLTRAPRREYDQKVELWLAPSLQYLPVRIRIEDEKGGVLDQRASRIELGAPAAAAKQESRQN